jgi:cellulose synthase/poly-beta-1,6-N-acetylglucosamine synthase-like glycosyltransferase
MLVSMPIRFVCTEKRHDDWGHSLRDRGIREAKGDYIVHFSSDNILYPDALMEISKAIDRPPRIVNPRTRKIGDSEDIIIFSILQRGMQRLGKMLTRNRNRLDYTLLMTGNPPMVTFIDCLQFVMRRELWLDEGGWRDKTYDGDGLMYQKFAAKYGYRAIDTVLGEHS